MDRGRVEVRPRLALRVDLIGPPAQPDWRIGALDDQPSHQEKAESSVHPGQGNDGATMPHKRPIPTPIASGSDRQAFLSFTRRRCPVGCGAPPGNPVPARTSASADSQSSSSQPRTNPRRSARK